DHGADQEPCQVLGAPEPVAVATGGGAASQAEGDDQRDRGGEMAEVVEGVGQQRDGSAEGDDDDLEQRGGAHARQADPGGADPDRAGLLGGAYRLAVVVAVRCQRVPDPCPGGGALDVVVRMVVPVVVAMLVVVPVPVTVLVIVRVSVVVRPAVLVLVVGSVGRGGGGMLVLGGVGHRVNVSA